MYPRLTLASCPSCSCQFFVNEPACPHCGEVVRAGDGRGVQRAAAALMLGLAVAAVPLAAGGCGDDTGTGDDSGVGGAYGMGGSSSTATDAASTTSTVNPSTSTGGDGGAGGQGGQGGDDQSVQAAYGVAPSASAGGGDDSGVGGAYGAGGTF